MDQIEELENAAPNKVGTSITQPVIARLKNYIVGYNKLLEVLEKHAAFFDGLNIQPQVWFNYRGVGIDLNNMRHSDSTQVFRYFGGKWRKQYNHFIRIYCGEPPPSCKLVPYEIEEPEQIIPARKVTKFKLECPKEVAAQ